MDHIDSYGLLDQIHELKERLRALAHENAELRFERDIALAKVHSLLPKATPAQEDEMRKLMETAVPIDMDALVADVLARGAK